MSGRTIFGKPVVAAAGCAVLGATALIAYVALKAPSTALTESTGPGCIALAIDRATGTTSAVPCGKTQMLLAEQAGPSK